jgi:hypothetical protein
LDTCFIHLLEFIRENVSIDGITELQIIGFLQHSDRVGIRIRTGKQFTNYNQKKKRASTHWAGTFGAPTKKLISGILVKKKKLMARG